MNIQGGALEFDVLFNNGQIDRALEETKKRVQGFSDATAAGGEKMEAAYQSAARYIEQGFETIGNTIKINETAIAKLQKKYNDLGAAAAEAFMKGDDNKYRNLTQQQAVIQNEIKERKKVVAALNEQEAALLKHNQQLEEEKNKVDNAANAQLRFRTQLMNVKNEMMRLQQAGQTNTEEFRRLTAEATRLQQAMNIANKQVKNLANPNLTFQGVISGLSGISGAASVAQGAIGLFAEKNEDLQKIMLKVQSLMAITMGLQQVNQTLLSTSAFRLGIVTKAQQLWTTAQARYVVVQRAANIASAAGTIANKGLATSFKMVSLAIKSIPGIGWLLAAITALVVIYTKITSKAREAKKAQEEFYKSVAENASKPISTINLLSIAWSKLGNNLKAKEQFIEDNKDKFNSLGASVKTAAEAEKLLIDNKDKFIASQILKAKALAATELASEKYKVALEKMLSTEKPQKYIGTGNLRNQKFDTGSLIQQFGRSKSEDDLLNEGLIKINPQWEKYQQTMKNNFAEANKMFEQAANFTQKEQAILAKIGQSANNITEGSIAALGKNINKLKDQYQNAATDLERSGLAKQIQAQEKILAKMDLLRSGKKDKKDKDPFTKDLEDKKKAYTEYFRWLNAGYQSEAKQEFSELLKGGKTYLDYLKKMREDTSLTKEQIHQITNEIAQETNTTILGEFESSLQKQLNNAQTVIDMLNIIKQQREELAKSTEETDPLKSEKEEIIDKQEEDVVKKQEETTKQLIAEYSNYTDKVIMLELELTNDLQLLEAKRAKATTEADKQAIDDIIKNRKQMYNEDKANLLSAGYEATRKLIDLGQDKELLNISKKAFTWEADRTKAMLETQKQAAQRTLEELQQMQKEAPTEEIAAEIEQLKLKIEELNAELEKMPNEKFQEMLSGFQKITGALGNLDGEVGEIFSSISSEIGNLKVAFDDTASKTDKISAGISGIVDIINMVSSASAERKRVEKEFYKNQIALVHEYALALNEQLRLQSELAGSGFVTNYAGKIEDGFNALSHATAQYQDALGKLNEGKAKVSLRNAVDWGNVGKGAAAGAAAGAAIGSVVPVIGTAIGAIVGGIGGAVTGLFGGKKKKEQYGGLLEVFPELVDDAGNLNKELAESIINTNQVDDKTKQLIQNALDWADAVEEANKQIKEIVTDLAGDLGNSIKTAMIDAWKAGEDSSKKMFEAASQSLEKFIEDLVYSTIFSDIFDEFADRLAKSLSPTGDGDIVDDYDYLMDKLDERDDLYLASLEAIRNRAKQRGFDLWTPDEDANKPTSLSGAIKGASQESIDLLAGQTNAVRVNQVESIEILRNSLIQLTMINANTSKANQHLEKIEKNTNNIPYDPLRAQGITG
jgi:hypothetical protein